MKRILCIILTIGVCVLTYAAKKNQTQEAPVAAPDYVSLMSAFIAHTDTILPVFKQVLSDNEALKEENNKLANEKQELLDEKKKVEDMLLTPELRGMLLMYPLMVKYDSSLVAQSLAIIEKFKMTEQKGRELLFEEMMPILNNYSVYHQEIYDMVKKILELYVEIGEPYKVENLERAYEATSYFKKCAKKGNAIPYLEQIVNTVRVYIYEDRLTAGNLQELLNDMKLK